MPPIALTGENSKRLGDLGPGHGVRKESDAMRSLLFVGVATEACDDFQVFAHRRFFIAADGDDCFPMEQAEGTRNDEVAAEVVPA